MMEERLAKLEKKVDDKPNSVDTSKPSYAKVTSEGINKKRC